MNYTGFKLLFFIKKKKDKKKGHHDFNEKQINPWVTNICINLAKYC